ncbi:MAG: CAP domain-containing protein [Chloroflexota bacterium]
MIVSLVFLAGCIPYLPFMVAPAHLESASLLTLTPFQPDGEILSTAPLVIIPVTETPDPFPLVRTHTPTDFGAATATLPTFVTMTETPTPTTTGTSTQVGLTMVVQTATQTRFVTNTPTWWRSPTRTTTVSTTPLVIHFPTASHTQFQLHTPTSTVPGVLPPIASATSTPTQFIPIAPTNTQVIIPPTNTATSSSCNPTYNYDFENQVVTLFNEQRALAGLPAYTIHSSLVLAARLHSQDMACNRYFSHTGLDGSTPRDRMLRQGYVAVWWGENISAGRNSPAQTVQSWMDSAPHRANILSTNVNEVGIGYVYLSGSPYTIYWTAVFGRR